VLVLFVDVGEINDNHCLNFLFIKGPKHDRQNRQRLHRLETGEL
jgi:hypothetical protein